MKNKKRVKQSELEKDYNNFFFIKVKREYFEDSTLEQPSPLKIVPSSGTSGAYEEPIKLDREIIINA